MSERRRQIWDDVFAVVVSVLSLAGLALMAWTLFGWLTKGCCS